MFTTIYIITLVFLAIFFFNFAPGGIPTEIRYLFTGYYFINDGVLNKGDKRCSLEAFRTCKENNFAIKTTIQLTKDRQIVVYPNQTLKKDFDLDTAISDLDFEQLKQYNIILLKDLLDLINGEVPLLLELKSGLNNEVLCEDTLSALTAYDHKNVGIASFHTGILAWFKKKAKRHYRGAISAPGADFIHLSSFQKFAVSNLFNNSVSRPNFVLYRKGKESFLLKIIYKLGFDKGIWLIEDKQEAKELETKRDLIIIEGFTPDINRYYTPEIKFKKQEDTQIDDDKIINEEDTDSDIDDIDTDDE